MVNKKRSEITILIVDDEKDICESLAENLEYDGFKTLTANNANEAIQKLQQHKIDIIVSDIRMPNGNGIDLLLFLKSNSEIMPKAILMSGQTEYTIEYVKNLGALDLISKPLSIDSLIELISKHI